MFPFELDLNLVLVFQSLGDWLIVPMRFFSFLGTEEFYLLIMPILYWCIDSKLGIRVGLILMLSSSMNFIFKIIFVNPRPYWVSTDVKALWGEIYFGIPSGHAQQSVAVWGIMASFLRRKWAWITAIFLIFMIGLSRVFLGAHFFIDMIIGWFIGGIILYLFIHYWDEIAKWAMRLSLSLQIRYALIISLGIIIIGWLLIFAHRNYVLPETWVVNAARIGDEEITPFTMNGIITSSSTLFGFLAGLAWMASRGGWQVSGSVYLRIGRYLVGVVGVLIFWYGLGTIFPRGESLIPYVFRFIRYAILGGWISAGAPLLFTKLKL